MIRAWKRQTASRPFAEVKNLAVETIGILMHFVWKNTTFRALYLQKFTKCCACACHDKWHSTSPNTVPATKSHLPTSAKTSKSTNSARRSPPKAAKRGVKIRLSEGQRNQMTSNIQWSHPNWLNHTKSHVLYAPFLLIATSSLSSSWSYLLESTPISIAWSIVATQQKNTSMKGHKYISGWALTG